MATKHPALTALRHQLRRYTRAKIESQRLRTTRSSDSIQADLRYMRAKNDVLEAYGRCEREGVHVPTEIRRATKRVTKCSDGNGYWVPVDLDIAYDPDQDWWI